MFSHKKLHKAEVGNLSIELTLICFL